MKIDIKVHTNSKNPKLLFNPDKSLDVYVSVSPIDGKANEAVIKSVAKYLGVHKSKVLLVSGLKSKKKVVEILE